MANFFDATWFNNRMNDVGLNQQQLARQMGLSYNDILAIWNDQRQISDSEFKVLASILERPEKEVRQRAGLQGMAHPRNQGGFNQGGVNPGGYNPNQPRPTPGATNYSGYGPQDPVLAARIESLELQMAKIDIKLAQLLRYYGLLE